MSLDVTLYLDKPCSSCGHSDTQVFSGNITHNLVNMAAEACIYAIVWRPEENGIVQAKQLIEPLERAIKEMRNDPERFKAFNASNGWGLYENFLPWLEEYLYACREFPDSYVQASR